MNFKGKNILITQNALRNFAGSEIVTLELANHFKSSGANVVVFTWFFSEPIKSEFEKAGIYVTTDEHDKALNHLDYVWVHHQVLPLAVIEALNNLGPKSPCFYFYHMSYMEDLFLEQPYILNLEKNLADKSIFASQESFDMNMNRNGSIFRKPSVFHNSSPDSFMINFSAPEFPRRIGIVSNHPPKEIVEAIDELKTHEIEAEIIGKDSNICRLATPEVLSQYDCIITIGKTIQYCLTSNIPVYLYDHFGGCGFLNKDNFEKAMSRNFSGRGFNKKTAKQIALDICKNYNEACKFQDENKEMFRQKFSLSSNLAKLFKETTVRQKTPFSTEYINYIVAAEKIAKDKVVAENYLVIKIEEEKELRKSIDHLNSVINKMENSRIIKLDKKIRSSINRIKSSFPANSAKKKSIIKINYKEYSIDFLTKKPVKIVGIIREKNESLILKDTLNELSKIVDGFIVLDDFSDDNSIEIAKKHPKCLAIIRHKKAIVGDRSAEESIHRELLLRCAKKLNPKWILYQDADERIDNPKELRSFLLDHIDDSSITGIRFSLFDAYMTKNDFKPYEKGPLLDFRKYFGQERRDILMAWKNTKSITFTTKLDMREPDGVDPAGIITKFFVQHYGKSLSEKQWEDTCDYYVAHFPQYAKKWAARKGKAIHNQTSDFGTTLKSWEELKKSGGIKIS